MLAILAATSVLGASANAQTSTSAPEQASMFVIATPAPGVVDFKGTGSATFTNTQSATESVTVGSNSSFGVTVSGANTSDYTSTAAAALKLDGTTSLNHATGTASNAFAVKYATDASGSMISTDPSGALIGDTTAKISSVLTTSKSGGMTEALESALSGSFAYQASQKALDVVGDSEDDTDGGSSGIIYYGDTAAYNAAFEAVYSEEYAKAYSTASAASPSKNEHNLVVTGLGTITNVDVLETSTFDASTQRVDGSSTQQGGTGSASASMTNANTSFANTASTSSASAFAQAFNGGNAANEGDLVITGVEPVTDASGGGFKVHAERVTTVDIVYTTDASGNISSN